jgi:hypothetical protein
MTAARTTAELTLAADDESAGAELLQRTLRTHSKRKLKHPFEPIR